MHSNEIMSAEFETFIDPVSYGPDTAVSLLSLCRYILTSCNNQQSRRGLSTVTKDKKSVSNLRKASGGI